MGFWAVQAISRERRETLSQARDVAIQPLCWGGKVPGADGPLRQVHSWWSGFLPVVCEMGTEEPRPGQTGNRAGVSQFCDSPQRWWGLEPKERSIPFETFFIHSLPVPHLATFTLREFLCHRGGEAKVF